MTMTQRLGLLGFAAVLTMTAPVVGLAAPFSFSDDFAPAPSSYWSNSSGNWTDIAPGDYAAQNPNNNPHADTYLPFALTNTNLQVTVTVNALGDVGIDFNSGNVELILGGDGYGNGSRLPPSGTVAYWVTPSAGGLIPPPGCSRRAILIRSRRP